MSLLNPTVCGFARVAIYEAMMENSNSLVKNNKSITGEVFQTCYEKFNDLFPDFEKVSYEIFRKKITKVKEQIFSLGRKNCEEKGTLLRVFGSSNWNKLTNIQKKHHSLYTCKECLSQDKYIVVLATIPILPKDKVARKLAQESGLFKPRKKDLKVLAKEKIKEVNKEFKEKYSVNFSSILRSIDNQKPSRVKKKEVIKEVKVNLQEQWQETAVLRTYGSSESLASRNRNRIIQSFESYEEAKTRSLIDKDKVAAGVKRPHNHVGNIDNYVFDRERCIKLVEERNDEEKINYSELAAKLDVRHINGTKPSNGGQIIKGFLDENGVDVSRFGNINGGFRIRKRRKRSQLCYDERGII